MHVGNDAVSCIHIGNDVIANVPAG
jgi:hypothetical protein